MCNKVDDEASVRRDEMNGDEEEEGGGKTISGVDKVAAGRGEEDSTCRMRAACIKIINSNDPKVNKGQPIAYKLPRRVESRYQYTCAATVAVRLDATLELKKNPCQPD